MSMVRSTLLATSLLIAAGCGPADLALEGEPSGDVGAEHAAARAGAGILLAQEPIPLTEERAEESSLSCTTPPAAGPLIGWASAAGGTQGGGSAAPVTVTTAVAFQTAVGDDTPRVVYVQGKLSTTSQFSIGSNKTIVGLCGAELRGSVSISGKRNIILRNLKIVGFNCSDSPDDCGAGADAVHVERADHLWFDHLDIADGSDGNLDQTRGVDYVTISWSKFSYSTKRRDKDNGDSGHRFSNLFAASDTDSGNYRITFHHVFWADNIRQRMPRGRFGQIHIFNSLYASAGNDYCISSGYKAKTLVENNIFSGVASPHDYDGGDLRASGNVYKSTTGKKNSNGKAFTPGYAYALDSTSSLEAAIRAGVGPR
jgi:pectate lyase